MVNVLFFLKIMSNTFSPSPLHGYSFKLVASIISLAGFVLFAWLKISGQPFSFIDLDFAGQEQGSLCFLALGLFLMAFSKEKVDDERVQLIRAAAMRLGFQILGSILLIWNFINIQKGIFEVPYTLELLTVSLLIYLLYFHGSLYFNLDVSGANNSVAENVRIKPKFYLIFIAVQVIALVLLFLFR